MSEDFMSTPIGHDDTPAARVNRLLAEARLAATEQVAVLEATMEAAVSLSAQIADGGEIYPPGVRELCRRITEEGAMHARTINALSTRLLEREGARRW
jgi:hypothetical protein